jgi:hypothetical protein
MKEEVLAGIREMINDEENYFFDFDNGNTANYILFRQAETNNFSIDIELDVHVAVHDTLGLLLTGLELRDLKVCDNSGNEHYLEVTDKEIENQLNIF